MSEEHVLEKLREAFSVPGDGEIAMKITCEVLGADVTDKRWMKSNFSNLVEETQHKAYAHYQNAERPAAAQAFRKVFSGILPKTPKPEDYFKLLDDNFWVLDRFFFGLAQGRRSRAGKAFEQVINALFTTLEYPYTSQPIINGQPDFLLPGIDHYQRNAMDCIIFTAKRSLRERWRQLVTKETRGPAFFLATIDEGIGTRDFADILADRIYLVMPERIRAKCYPIQTNVLSFENFFQHYLDPAMTRWRANGVIPA